MIDSRKEEKVSRRRFLGYVVGGIGALIAAAAGVPVIGYFISPALEAKKAGTATNIGPVSQFQVNQPQLVMYEGRAKDGWITTSTSKSAWVVKYDDGSIVVFEPHCTHLGCPYSWHGKGEDAFNKGQPHFHSPCHEGIFDVNGNVVSGPPPRPLDRIEYEIEKGDLYLSDSVVRGDNLKSYRTLKV